MVEGEKVAVYFIGAAGAGVTSEGYGGRGLCITADNNETSASPLSENDQHVVSLTTLFRACLCCRSRSGREK